MRIKDMPLTPVKNLPRTRICKRCGHQGRDVHLYRVENEHVVKIMLCDDAVACTECKYGQGKEGCK